ncbi:MAG: hypothetical protein ACI4QM_05395, partial [Alphaproteobacteria bacterium]
MLKSVLAFLVLLSVGVATAAPTTADLKRIEQQLQQERKAGLEARKKASELTHEMKTVQQQIMGSAKTVQEKEATLTSLEEQLDTLNIRER